MEKIQDENKEMSETFEKLKFILSQDKNDQTTNDILYKYQLKLLFIPKDDSFELAFDKESDIAKLIVTLVDLLHLVFQKPKIEREQFYNINVYDIKEDKFLEIIKKLQILQNFNIDFTNDKLAELFKIISFALDQKKIYSFAEYIDSILINLSFVQGLESLLKYQLYSMLMIYYLNPNNIALDFDENEINISDDNALDLIIELFSNEQNDFFSLIKAIIYLNYGSLKNSLMNYTIDEILSSIETVYLKLKSIKNIRNMSIFVEKITTMFLDELNRPKDKKEEKKKNKKKKKSKKLKLDNNEKTDKKVEENNSIKKTENTINLTEGIIDIKSNKDVNEIIESVEEQNDKKDDGNKKDNLNQGEELNKYSNTKINNYMGNENVEKDLLKVQNVMFNIVDETNKMKGKIEEMSKDIEELKESVEFLRGEFLDMKETLRSIQCRDLSKNFLRCFRTLLTKEDWKGIRKNKNKRGEIISERIVTLYPNAEKKKMEIVQKLVENSSNFILEGNYEGHFLIVDKFQKEIEDYKKKKNLKKLTSPIAFCFLVSLGISDELFDNAYSFLNKFFNKDLNTTEGDKLLDLYFS